MNLDKFLRVLWAINGVLLLLVFLGISYPIATWILPDRREAAPPRDAIAVAAEPDEETIWRLGRAERLEDTDYVVIPLSSEDRSEDVEGGFLSKRSRARPTRNLLFINVRTDEQHWLFESRDLRIHRTIKVHESGLHGSGKVLALLYRVTEQDSDGDGELTTGDRESLAISGTDGSGLRTLATDVDRFGGATVVDGEDLLLIFQRDGVGYSLRVDLATLTPSPETELKRPL